jgi:hypothetical protein
MGCASKDYLEQGALWLRTYKGPAPTLSEMRQTVFALVPDGYTRVSWAGGEVDVRNNVAVLTGSGRMLTMSGAQGTQTIDLGKPD